MPLGEVATVRRSGGGVKPAMSDFGENSPMGGKPVQESSREFRPTPSSLVAQKA